MSYAEDMGYDAYEPEEPEDEIVERYRNWPIRKDVGGSLYVKFDGDESYFKTVDAAKKEIDKAIKNWNAQRGKWGKKK